jgi:hypothetical protein
MAGERYAKLTVRAAWSWNAFPRGKQTEEIRIKLAGQWETFRRGGNATEFVVPDPGTGGPDPRDFVLRGVNNLLALVRARIAQRGLSYSVSVARDMGDDSSHVGTTFYSINESNSWPIVEFDITANLYDSSYDLGFVDNSPAGTGPYGGWQPTLVATISPVQVTANVTNAGIYGSATGRIELSAVSNQTGYFTYQWDDQAGLGIPVRGGVIGPRTYGCLVTADTGASTYVAPYVGSDPRLEVVAQSTSTTITLLITGGLPPYTVQWDDGSTSPSRTGLTRASYHAVITDSRGAQVDITVDLNRAPYHWSRNPVTLALDAGAAYRLDPTTKPNLSFLCEVWLELDYLSGTFVQVGTTLEQPADRQGRTTFDVQALLDAFLRAHVPAPNTTTPERADALFKRFYLVHHEQFGTPPVAALRGAGRAGLLRGRRAHLVQHLPAPAAALPDVGAHYQARARRPARVPVLHGAGQPGRLPGVAEGGLYRRAGADYTPLAARGGRPRCGGVLPARGLPHPGPAPARGHA